MNEKLQVLAPKLGIETILDKMHSYVRDVVSRVEDDFDDCVDFEDYITESVIKNTKENLATL